MPKGVEGSTSFLFDAMVVAAAGASCHNSLRVSLLGVSLRAAQNSICVIMLPKYSICIGYGHVSFLCYCLSYICARVLFYIYIN